MKPFSIFIRVTVLFSFCFIISSCPDPPPTTVEESTSSGPKTTPGTIYIRNALILNDVYCDIDIYIDSAYQTKLAYGKVQSFTIRDDEYHNLTVKSGTYSSSGKFLVANRGELRVYVTSTGIWQE